MQESQWCSSSPNAGRLETQEELSPEAGKKKMFQLEGSQKGGISLLGGGKEGQLFCCIQAFKLTSTHLMEGNLFYSVYLFEY